MMQDGEAQIAILIDPEKNQDRSSLLALIEKINFAGVDFIFVGGSTVSSQEFEFTCSLLQQHTTIPIVIFPGGSNQLSEHADALLFLSLLSGRNPDFLIGHHIQAIPSLLHSQLEIIPTGYILIDGESPSSVAYISQTTPIPQNQTKIAVDTALAGVFQGKQVIFFDAGSGAKRPVPPRMVEELRKHVAVPIIVGGGIRTIEQIATYHAAGANVVVIGNHIEEHADFLLDLHSYLKND